MVWILCAFYVGVFAGVFITGLARAAGSQTPRPVEASVQDDGCDRSREFAA